MAPLNLECICFDDGHVAYVTSEGMGNKIEPVILVLTLSTSSQVSASEDGHVLNGITFKNEHRNEVVLSILSVITLS